MPWVTGRTTRPVTKYVANDIVATYRPRDVATDLGMSGVGGSRVSLFVIGYSIWALLKRRVLLYFGWSKYP